MEEAVKFVYVYLDPRKPGTYNYNQFSFDYEPFYIGKGSKNRHRHHLTKEGKNRIRFGKIKHIKEQLNREPIIIKIVENLQNKDASKLEIELIKLIGRIDLKTGPLTNLTDGGECGWFKGQPWTEEQRIKLMAKRKIKQPMEGKKQSDEAKMKISLANLGRKFSEEHKKALQRKFPEAHKKKLSERKSVPVYAIKNKKIIKVYKNTLEIVEEFGNSNFAAIYRAVKSGKLFNGILYTRIKP